MTQSQHMPACAGLVSAILLSTGLAFSAVAGLAGAAVAFAAPAQAADQFRYVSVNGSNANNCRLANPCRTLQRGINQTPVGGELRILDSGRYGKRGRIRKSLTISGNGNTVFVANGIVIDDADAVVVLRRLVLDGHGTAVSGIEIRAATAVHVEGCVVQHFANEGIFLNQASAHLYVTDTISRHNPFGALVVDGTGADVKLTVDNARLEHSKVGGVSGNGLRVVGNVDAAVNRTVFAGNGNNGLSCQAGPRVSVTRSVAENNGGSGYLLLADCDGTLSSSSARGNGSGLSVISGVARISDSVFVNNSTGIRNNNGTVLTRENNTVSGNTNDVDGSLTALAPL